MTANTKKKVNHVEEITSFKGFNDKWECRGFKFKLGETVHHDGEVTVCKSGFHACEYPLDVFNYYTPSGNRFAIVTQSGDLSRHDGDTKVSSKSISIVAEIDISGLVKAAIEYTTSRCTSVDHGSPASATGDRGAASATGDRGAASATGYLGAASATGDRGAASATGIRGAASATGDQGAASATGGRGAASATGYLGAASATGEASVAAATGCNGRAKGAEGCAIVLVHRQDDGKIIHIRASKVGDNGIKPDIWYALDADGQFVEIAQL